MKKLKLFSLVALLLCQVIQAQVFDVDTILWSGPSDNRVNLVILGDGYTSSEQDKFISDAQSVADQFIQTAPYTAYKNYFNILAIKVISNQSGASHGGVSSDNQCGSQPVATVDNYFGSSFDCGNNSYHRLLCASKSYKVSGVMASNWPNYDQALIIVNTTYYGGAGGSIAVSSMNSEGPEIAIHEVGHSYAYLADEYWAGSQYATNAKANMTNNSNINTVKWKNWVGTNTVGLYPHSGDPSWFKPVTGKCKMEYLGKTYPFCPVCTETHILKTLDLTKPYDGFSPSNGSVLDLAKDSVFSIANVLPIPNTLKISWNLNGQDVQVGVNSNYTLNYNNLQSGSNTLKATLIDTTASLRNSNHVSSHTYQITWNITKSNLTSTILSTQEADLQYSLFPNPTNNFTVFTVDFKEENDVILNVCSLEGQVLKSLSYKDIQAGPFSIELSAASLDLPTGVYLLNLSTSKGITASEKWLVQ